ncbi:helix-turn-helix domain-containing protein [Pseudogracilibacillus sp. SO30301A]|uniref:helix-turn-helix domain-containing protein n=1 Tax=Pseudogracilibacillus sp. SO30301A TaxID=3098291 RepID=UPI00300E1A12
MQQSQMVTKTERHLRRMSRHLIKIDSEEKALQYISNSFQKKLHCDFVGIVFLYEETFKLRVISGKVKPVFSDVFPIEAAHCSSQLLKNSMTNEMLTDEQHHCPIIVALNNASVNTWFTVPIQDDLEVNGFCVIGFYESIPLLEMKNQFEEFGKDIALAIHITRERKKQLKKMEGIEWVINNLSLDLPFKEKISEITSMAGKGTGAQYACIYLFNDIDNEFIFQSPSYGKKEMPKKIKVTSNNALTNYFPYLDKIGANKMTTLIAMDFKTIGVIHLEDKDSDGFNAEDLDTVQLLSTHIATSLENARLYHNEQENHERLRSLLNYQEALVKKTVDQEDFAGITDVVHQIFYKPIILFDHFKNCLHFHTENQEELNIQAITKKIKDVQENNMDYFLISVDGKRHTVWPIKRGDELLGYVSIEASKKDLDEYDQLMIEIARNIYATQFSKRKFIYGTTEQAKENLATSLLVPAITDKDKVLQYANLFHWNIYHPHRVAMLSLEVKNGQHETDLLDAQMGKTAIWDYLKQFILEKEMEVIAAPFKEQFVLFVPDQKDDITYYRNLMQEINRVIMDSAIICRALLGIGSVTASLEDYYVSSEQAYQALKIIQKNYHEMDYAFFENLGAYTVLQHLQHVRAAELFMTSQLEPILEYSKKSNMDLLHTLKSFLSTNCNAKQTADLLFLHRSSLRYRLEKIEELLHVDLDNSEHIFQLMMALKLYDMHT